MATTCPDCSYVAVNERALLYHLKQGCKVTYKRRRHADSDSDEEGLPPAATAAATGAAPHARGLGTGTLLQPATDNSGLISGLPAVNAEVGGLPLQQDMHQETQRVDMQQQGHQTHSLLQRNQDLLRQLMLQQSNDEPLEQDVPEYPESSDDEPPVQGVPAALLELRDAAHQLGMDLDVHRAGAALEQMDRVAEQAGLEAMIDAEIDDELEWLRLGDQEDDEESDEVAELAAKLHEPLYPGARVTLLQTCFLMLARKRLHVRKDADVETECKLKHDLELPADNNHPRTLYVMKKLLACKAAEHVQRHVCPKGCCVFAHIPKSDYKYHADDSCESCGALRFERKQRSRGPSLVPRRVYYDMGVRDVIKYKMFGNTTWCMLRLSHDYV